MKTVSKQFTNVYKRLKTASTSNIFSTVAYHPRVTLKNQTGRPSLPVEENSSDDLEMAFWDNTRLLGCPKSRRAASV
jgi:hypothetical protein